MVLEAVVVACCCSSLPALPKGFWCQWPPRSGGYCWLCPVCPWSSRLEGLRFGGWRGPPRTLVQGALPAPQVNGVSLHGAEHHVAVEALRGSGSSVSMTVLRERMVEPENAITVTPLRPEDDYSPREWRGGLQLAVGAKDTTATERLSACLVRNERGLGFSIAGGKGSTPYRPGDTVRGEQEGEPFPAGDT